MERVLHVTSLCWTPSNVRKQLRFDTSMTERPEFVDSFEVVVLATAHPMARR